MQCSHCGRQITLEFRNAPCPDCGLQPTAEKPPAWKSIAQLNNLAEAGFYADFLEGEGFSTRVNHRHDYSALDATWDTSFELQVSADEVTRAFATLQKGIEQHEDGRDSDESWGESGASSQRRAAWAGQGSVVQDEFDGRRRSSTLSPPLVWVLVAGGLAYTLGRSGVGPAHHSEQDVVWQAIRHSSPFISEPAEGNPRRCLRYDPAQREFVLEEDQNGDGVWDLQWRFSPTP